MKNHELPSFTARPLGHGLTIADAGTQTHVAHVCPTGFCWCKHTATPRVTLYEDAYQKGTAYVAALRSFINTSCV